MKKFIWLMLTAVLMLTPMTAIAAESTYSLQYVNAAEENNFSDALYDTEHSPVIDWTDAVL